MISFGERMSKPLDATPESVSLGLEDGIYYAYHDMEEDGLTFTITKAMSEVTGKELHEVIPRFAEYVDPDALNRLFKSRPDRDHYKAGPLYLTIEGHEVAIYSDGEIQIRPNGWYAERVEEL
ncbi:HalOD1 output domain-containing protein [Haladaptatus sp. CMSO5]|uniref:HalOD1 output domain-containing protein n=1 Tax=Haladaptatus sp. CMSO5 TaxID=3120514 RepID=UPI002FCE1B52